MGVSGKGRNSTKKGWKKREKGLQIAALHGYIARTFPSRFKELNRPGRG
jgi:hypothetical protein